MATKHGTGIMLLTIRVLPLGFPGTHVARLSHLSPAANHNLRDSSLARSSGGANDLRPPRGVRRPLTPGMSPECRLPIELIFSKIKQLLRTLACRTKDALWTSMQAVLDEVTASDAANCFRHCGYSLQSG